MRGTGIKIDRCNKFLSHYLTNLVHKFCASNWLNSEINILRCTVSNTSKHCNKWILCLLDRASSW